MNERTINMKYKNNLLHRLTEYEKDGLVPFHMPGHKRNGEKTPDINPYGIDITEIDGFDDLNHPDGVINDAMERAALVFGSRKTYFLVNGATSGILTSITSICHNGGKLLLAANSHKSAFNAAYINKLEPVYVFPDESEVIHAKDVEKALAENDDIKCVFITSPTYTGVVSDIRAIADVTHSHGAVLVVDEAHGAHMMFNDIFPESALTQGADIVIHGMHKTLPSLTQTALLHVGENCFVAKDREEVCSDEKDTVYLEDEIEKCLSIFTSSSPSYILMGAIDYCMDYLECDGEAEFKIYADNLREVYNKLDNLKNFRVLPYSKNRDASKIVICTNPEKTGVSGKMLYDYFRKECGLQPEMSMPEYVIMMTSVWDKKEDLDKLAESVLKPDEKLSVSSYTYKNEDNITNNKPDETTILTHNTDTMKLKGKTANHLIYVYPPGVPIVLPGRTINEEDIKKIEDYINKGYKVYGLNI